MLDMVTTADLYVGMPHLDVRGLSETFAIKEAGHRHWQLLERVLGVRSRDWRDDHGRRSYASFVHSDLHYGDDRGGESDDASIRCELLGFEAPFAASRTTVMARGRTLMEIDLLSSFIVRMGGDNTAFVRSESTRALARFGAEAIGRMKRDRKALLAAPPATTHALDHAIRPEMDFNNASFMYFANFTRLLGTVDCGAARHGLRRRTVAYCGNANASDRLRVHADPGDAVGYHITRVSDGRTILAGAAAFEI